MEGLYQGGHSGKQGRCGHECFRFRGNNTPVFLDRNMETAGTDKPERHQEKLQDKVQECGDR
ncbi:MULTISPECIES: hypothetical protein [unclassified Commensalibacter]|uniref:hypothetical protein n=1 Tax=unclassified Commensalibacter TaxID=2630218 RepID=UPI001E435412|nr:MULTISPECIES: hypothetical protein [unclassified Commensalibacter]